MSVQVKLKHNGTDITTLDAANSLKVLKTANKLVTEDINVELTGCPVGNINITNTTVTNVEDYATALVVDANLVANNIKKNVNILGVTGTLETGITPTGKINITDTAVKDVTNYAQALIVDANLTAANIAKDVTVLGITGTHQGGVTPTGKINITNMNETDVTNYATAQVVDANLVAGNIKSGVTALGIEGTFTSDADAAASDILSTKTAYVNGSKVTGSMANNGDVTDTISTLGGTKIIPAGYTSGGTITASITPSVLDNTIISGQAFEEATGDYAWKSTVSVPAGYHNAQTIEKTFSDIFPAPETEGTASELRLGYQLFNHEGKKITGTMTEKTAATYTASTSDQVISGSQYLTGDQTIKAVSLNATASNILAGTSVAIESNGSTVTSVNGTIPSKAAETFTPGTSDQTISADQYLSGVQTISGDANLVAGNIAQGSSIFGVSGSYTSDANATAALILSGNTAYVNGVKLTGTLASYNMEHREMANVLCFTANEANSTISMTVTGTSTLNPNFQTSTDNGITWQEFIPGTTTITLINIGDKVHFKGNNPNGISEANLIYYKFIMTGSIAASGNIMSLIDNGTCNTLTIPNNFCFNALFSGCAALTSAPVLPAITLTEECYLYMFNNCTSLVTAPALPSTTLANGCYMYMFNGCTLLENAPTLSAMTLPNYCYIQMFSGCTSLETAPALPATTLGLNCYYGMFWGCTALKNAPNLPATELPTWCYYCMFYGCTALETAPTIAATTLNGTECCAYMFRGCIALTTPPPSLLATTLTEKCYYYMFYGCAALETAPSIAATTLALSSCEYMFWNCTSLTTAPALYFTNLVNACYAMFGNCTTLQVWSTSGAGHDKAWRIPATGTITTAYEQDFMFYGCAGTRSSDHLPGEAGASYTYYTLNTPV